MNVAANPLCCGLLHARVLNRVLTRFHHHSKPPQPACRSPQSKGQSLQLLSHALQHHAAAAGTKRVSAKTRNSIPISIIPASITASAKCACGFLLVSKSKAPRGANST